MKKNKRKRAPIGTQERMWQDAIGKARRLEKKFSRKRRSGVRKHSKKMSLQQMRKMSELHNQYGGSIVGSEVQHEAAPNNIKKLSSPVVSAMNLHDNKLDDIRNELYPE